MHAQVGRSSPSQSWRFWSKRFYGWMPFLTPTLLFYPGLGPAQSYAGKCKNATKFTTTMAQNVRSSYTLGGWNKLNTFDFVSVLQPNSSSCLRNRRNSSGRGVTLRPSWRNRSKTKVYHTRQTTFETDDRSWKSQVWTYIISHGDRLRLVNRTRNQPLKYPENRLT